MTDPRPTLLIVDDTPEIIRVLNLILRDHYRIMAATTGQRALELSRQTPPSLVLLDVRMPEMDGHEVCRRLKADPATAAIPVIFITGGSDQWDPAQGFALGAVDYITKPIRPELIRAKIETHLVPPVGSGAPDPRP